MTSNELKNMENELINNGVPEKKAKELSNKMKNGKLIDSMLMSDNDAINVEEKEEDGYTKIIHTFPDGSISISGMETVKYVNEEDFKNVSPFASGIKDGKCVTGSTSSTCTNRTVYYNNPGVWKISFKANYTHVIHTCG